MYKTQNIGIIDYGMGNIKSVFNSLKYLGYKNLLLAKNPDDIAKSDLLILPGVGAFSDAMTNLNDKELIEPLNLHAIKNKKPTIGICLGMQLFMDSSDEGIGAKGLGWIPGHVKKFEPNGSFKIPHMGWDNIKVTFNNDLFIGIPKDNHFYFVHSYYVDCDEKYSFAECDYGIRFSAAVSYNNLVAFQFHPEKSHTNGLKLLSNTIKKIST